VYDIFIQFKCKKGFISKDATIDEIVDAIIDYIVGESPLSTIILNLPEFSGAFLLAFGETLGQIILGPLNFLFKGTKWIIAGVLLSIFLIKFFLQVYTICHVVIKQVARHGIMGFCYKYFM
jgi:hypothetical protein